MAKQVRGRERERESMRGLMNELKCATKSFFLWFAMEFDGQIVKVELVLRVDSESSQIRSLISGS